ncbi:MAG: hypothetical protein OEW90_22180 [Betaproteobacteria bacterium]|nr:hypothetical protein [Betaproteobacteria bacterium]MDH4326856.1 hypothetical protein [Betaproteobacteria bacterium]MDH5212090.1 hypothetical protein [Betaproteobacteria bacterium]
MTSKIAIAAALLAAALALPSQARAPEKQAAWLLLAQERSVTCELDGRKVPQGMTICRAGYVHTCGRSGQWERSRKPC